VRPGEELLADEALGEPAEQERADDEENRDDEAGDRDGCVADGEQVLVENVRHDAQTCRIGAGKSLYSGPGT
jgi:hypothetical protein